MTETQPSFSTNQQATYRILDANLDRAREGIRIIEEWCRFGLDDSTLAQTCKVMRQTLAKWHTAEIHSARNTPDDCGTTLTHPQEETRDSPQQVLQINLARTQEALRVLEEYGKLYHPEMGNACKQLRYQIYTLESTLFATSPQGKLDTAKLYLVTSPTPNLLSIVEAALKGGLSLVQYRNKDAEDQIQLEEGKQLCELCHQYSALFLMNDRADLALAVGADGVHLGQQDISMATARRILGSNKIIGKSTTNPHEMSSAIAQGADYVGVGPVYKTPTKPGKAPAGLDYVRYAAKHCSIPWFAIGGINADNIQDVIEAQANGVAVVRAIMSAPDPQTTTENLLMQFSHSRNHA
ncbi:MAG: thiamine phosphate synthase [Halothece sp. Uz-M2-17]|nr:thiamine phosphate synthase [Halothece sp. Uz-M2-17]